nr:hypothetical protein CFP56_29981 [Quercus suber]
MPVCLPARSRADGGRPRSGLDFISLRAGQYADAFPMFLNYYPSTKTIQLPELTPPVTDSRIAFATRDELAEGIAALLAKGLDAYPSIVPRTAKNIILLTGPKAESLVDLVGAISRGRGSEVPVAYMEPEEWIDNATKIDEGGKSRAFFEGTLVYMKGVIAGDAEVVDSALEVLLGRRPETGTEATERLIKSDPGVLGPMLKVSKGSDEAGLSVLTFVCHVLTPQAYDIEVDGRARRFYSYRFKAVWISWCLSDYSTVSG